MVEISEDKLNSLMQIIQAIIDSGDIEIKNCALLALLENLEEIKLMGDE